VTPESVWDYPRPPRVEPTTRHVVVRHRGFTIADGRTCLRVLETLAPAGLLHTCAVDGEIVVPQPGDFYGGWVTSDIVGPIKGATGTLGW
jgi:hypothetical protein